MISLKKTKVFSIKTWRYKVTDTKFFYCADHTFQVFNSTKCSIMFITNSKSFTGPKIRANTSKSIYFTCRDSTSYNKLISQFLSLRSARADVEQSCQHVNCVASLKSQWKSFNRPRLLHLSFYLDILGVSLRLGALYYVNISHFENRWRFMEDSYGFGYIIIIGISIKGLLR